jgi:hypothetical protein
MPRAKNIKIQIICWLCSLSFVIFAPLQAQTTRSRYGLTKRLADKYYFLGQREAKKDIKVGKYQIKIYGLPGDFDEMYHFALIMRDEYGLEYTWENGCTTAARLMNRLDGYNDYMSLVLTQKHGDKFFAQIEQRAKAEHQACKKANGEQFHLFPYLPDKKRTI